MKYLFVYWLLFVDRMAFEDNKQFWEEFIELYRERPCLWDTKSREYSNRNIRNSAYEALITKCKEKFPDADRNFVSKKINSLRSSFQFMLILLFIITDNLSLSTSSFTI